MITTTAVFDHTGRAKGNRPGMVEIRVIVNRTPYYIGTGVRVLKSEFKYGQIVDRADAMELNERLGIVSRIVESEVNACIADGRAFKSEAVRKRLSAQEEADEGTGFLDWCREQVGLLQLKEGTVKHYRTLLDRMEEYGLTAWDEVTAEELCKFDAWLHQLPSRQTEAKTMMGIVADKMTDAGIYTYHKCLKALLNRAVKFGRLDSNPYVKLRGEFKRGDVETLSYLTEEEMLAFESLHPVAGSQMAVARDLFVFQMYTGMSDSDMQAFDSRDYKRIGVDGIDGQKTKQWAHVGTRIKTGVPYVSQLLPPVVDVLERYGWQVPKITNQEYNKCLKTLGVAAGISRPLHCHMARHTFATFALSKGVRIENVGAMLGQKNIKTTQRYAKVLAEDVRADFGKIETAIGKR